MGLVERLGRQCRTYLLASLGRVLARKVFGDFSSQRGPVGRIHLTKDVRFFRVDRLAEEVAPCQHVSGHQWRRAVLSVVTFGAQLPEAFPKVLSTLWNLCFRTLDAEALISLASGFPVTIRRVVADLYSDGFGEIGPESLEKFAMSSAASVTCAKIQSASPRIVIAVSVEYSGVSPFHV